VSVCVSKAYLQAAGMHGAFSAKVRAELAVREVYDVTQDM